MKTDRNAAQFSLIAARRKHGRERQPGHGEELLLTTEQNLEMVMMRSAESWVWWEEGS